MDKFSLRHKGHYELIVSHVVWCGYIDLFARNNYISITIVLYLFLIASDKFIG